MRRGVEVAHAELPRCVHGRACVLVRHLAVQVAELRAAERQLAERRYHRRTRAPAPATSDRTSSSVAVDVSPGVVIASAPCAAPYSTASPSGMPSSIA